jgi:hypothetical protein
MQSKATYAKDVGLFKHGADGGVCTAAAVERLALDGLAGEQSGQA